MIIGDMETATVYEAGIARLSLWQAWQRIVRNCGGHWRLIRELAARQLIAEWKRSHLGAAWIYLMPLLTTAVWILLHSSGLLDSGSISVPYPLYALLSICMWQMFTGAFGSVSDSLSGSGGILLQNRIPPETMALSALLVHLFRILIPLTLILVLLGGMTQTASSAWLLLPVTLVPLVCAGVALGLFFALIKIVALDIFTLFSKFLSFAMFITPVIYSEQIESTMLRRVIAWNPITYLIAAPRDLVLSGSIERLHMFLYVSVASLLLLLFTARLFVVAAPCMYERIYR
jgi:ABC-type polysaccharide/polyol phosphate export permease